MNIRKWLSGNALIILLVLIFLLSTFPGKGGLEGEQREIDSLSNRSDNWGFLVPWIIGDWPNVFGNWRYSLVLIQLGVLWTGLYLFIKSKKIGFNPQKVPLFACIYISTIFASQLWRDASLFAFTVLGLGILNTSLRVNRKLRYLLILISLAILIFAAMFKPVFGVIIGAFVLWFFLQEYNLNKKIIFLSLPLLSLMALAPMFIDKSLSNFVGLNKTYPEQQPIIFDLASNYCWGSSDQVVTAASEGLKIVLKKDFPIEATCASLRPNSWDNLHSNPMKWQFSSPLFRITGDDDTKVRQLEKKWMEMIIRNPIDWAQTRFFYLGPTLIMSNSFTEQPSLSHDESLAEYINYYSWKVISYPALILDKSRVTSLGFSLILLILILIWTLKIQSRKAISIRLIDIYFAISLNFLTIVMTLISYTANNGRYVLPFILLNYLFLIRSIKLRSPIQV